MSGNTTYISEMDVRLWLRDANPEANLLLDDWEFGSEEIRTASTLAVDYWNETPPSLNNAHYSTLTFPFRYNLLMATCANLLFMAANLYRRNRMPYQIEGGTVDDQNKAQEYDHAGARLWDQYKQWVRAKKVEMNMDRGWSHN